MDTVKSYKTNWIQGAQDRNTTQDQRLMSSRGYKMRVVDDNNDAPKQTQNKVFDKLSALLLQLNSGFGPERI